MCGIDVTEVENSSSPDRMKQVVLDLDEKDERPGGSLVGKLLTNKSLNIPTVISMIKKGWQVETEFDVHVLDRNNLIFLFRFQDNKDYGRILKGRPWSILGFLLNLQVWDDSMILEDVNFEEVPFWVQFHGLPIVAFDNNNAKILGDSVGETVMLEKPMNGGRLGRNFIRVRSLIQPNKPLTSSFWVPRK